MKSFIAAAYPTRFGRDIGTCLFVLYSDVGSGAPVDLCRVFDDK